jgi:hypothetical protein
MTSPDLHDDDQLLAALSSALEAVDPVPEVAVSAAVAAFDLGHLEGELAALVSDSLLDDAALALRHDGDLGRVVTFEASSVLVELDLAPDGRGLVGQIDPVGPTSVDVEVGGGRQQVAVDELGRFEARIGPGNLRVHLAGPLGPVVTPWIVR